LQQSTKEEHRPSSISVAGSLLILVGLLAFINSYLIITSANIWGWLIVGAIGLVSLACGIGLFQNANWSYNLGLTIAIMNFFLGAIEILGSFNDQYQIHGWLGAGEITGTLTVILTVLAVFFLYRKESRAYYQKRLEYEQY
jgi:hypothetical protein